MEQVDLDRLYSHSVDSKVASVTEHYVRFEMRAALRRLHQVIALRLIAENGGRVSVSSIRNAIQARHPGNQWDRRYPIGVLRDRGIIKEDGEYVEFVEALSYEQRASVLAALDERGVRVTGLRVEDNSWRPDAAEWTRLRELVLKRDGEQCNVLNCHETSDLQLDHRWRGSLLAAQGWSPQAINDPINLQLLCKAHHEDKTASETALLNLAASGDDLERSEALLASWANTNPREQRRVEHAARLEAYEEMINKGGPLLIGDLIKYRDWIPPAGYQGDPPPRTVRLGWTSPEPFGYASDQGILAYVTAIADDGSITVQWRLLHDSDNVLHGKMGPYGQDRWDIDYEARIRDRWDLWPWNPHYRGPYRPGHSG